MPNEPGVNTVSPSDDLNLQPRDPGEPGSSPVISDVPSDTPTDRPAGNLKAEFDRKMGKLDEKLDQLTAYVSRLAQPQPSTNEPAATSGKKEYTDEELHTLWQQGYQEAGDILIKRKVDREFAARQETDKQDTLVNSQLSVLFQRYPVLADPAHPLTKMAVIAKRALLANGRSDTRATELEAILLAIADYVAQPRTDDEDHAEPTSRPSSVVVPGATVRRAPTARPKEPAMDPRSLEVAKRMNIKDPAGSRKRFYERNAKGTSSISPMVAQLIKEEE